MEGVSVDRIPFIVVGGRQLAKIKRTKEDSFEEIGDLEYEEKEFREEIMALI